MNARVDLMPHVIAAYAAAESGELDNETLYEQVAQRAGVDRADLNRKTVVSGQRHNLIKRAIRWHQQTLKHAGVLDSVPGKRGLWAYTEKLKSGLTQIATGIRLVAFSTDLGVAIWASHRDVFPHLDQKIAVCITSPPYLLRKARAYGGLETEAAYIDFICEGLEPIVANLLPGGSIILNLSNDCFEPGTPARSLYRERLVLALHDRLGLYKMDTLIWENRSKPPGPMQWASKERVQLNVAYEPVYWFTNDPTRVRADNRRVLQPHSERHQRNLQRWASAGHDRQARYSDGAYTLRQSSFTNLTAGSIPKNVLQIGSRCADSDQYRRDARELGLPVHGAMMPLALPEFLIEFLSEKDDLIVDNHGGTAKTAMAAEKLGRRWLVTEIIWEYLRGSAPRFSRFPGFRLGEAFRAPRLQF